SAVPLCCASAALRRLRRSFDTFTLCSDDGNHFADGCGGALLQSDILQDTAAARDQLHGRLVGLDLRQDIALGDGVALALQPLDELSLLHRRGQRLHVDLCCHLLSPYLAPAEYRLLTTRYLYSTFSHAAITRSTEGFP